MTHERRYLKPQSHGLLTTNKHFQAIQKETFRAMCKKLNKFYTVSTRRTLVRGILDAYERSIEGIREVFDAIPGRVALACDEWSSRTYRG